MSDEVAAIQGVLDAARDACGVPGVALAVTVDTEPVFDGASGSADLAGREPLRAGAIFPIYSITKTLTAVCALRLAERGVLVLDDTLDRWLPALPFAARVSLRQLLRHTAGVPNYSLDPAQLRALEASPTKAWDFDDFAAATCFRGLDFEPGESWAYSNTGYMLVKRVLEDAAGTPFAALIEEHVVDPLGLQHTRVMQGMDAFQVCTPGFSETFGDAQGAQHDVRGRYDPGWCATGVAYSTAAETCRFFDALLAGELLTPVSLDQMLDAVPVPGVDVPGTPSYGLGIMANPQTSYGAWYGHGGGGPGYDLRVSHLRSLGERSLTVAALCNCDRGNGAEEISTAVMTALASA